MYDRIFPSEISSASEGDSLVPIDQIAETRRTFPVAELGYELLIEAPDLLAGLAHCADLFARARLELKSLRCGAGGRICCRLSDRGGADLALLARELAGPVGRIESWTTVIGTQG